MSKELVVEIIDSLKNHPEDWVMSGKNTLDHKLYEIDINVDMYNVVWGRKNDKYQSIEIGFFDAIKIKKAAKPLLKKLLETRITKKISDFDGKI